MLDKGAAGGAMLDDATAPKKVGADSMRVDSTGQIVEWRCHYD